MGNRGQQGVQVEAALPCARKSWAPSQSSASHRREEKRICLQGPCHSLSGSLIKWQSPPANLWSVPLLRNVYQIEPLLLVGPCPSPQVPRETSRMVRHSVPRAFTSLYLLTKLYEAVTEPVLHSQRVCAQSLSRARFFAPFWTVAHQAPLSMGFSRQEYWSGLFFPSPWVLPSPGVEPTSLRLLHWPLDSSLLHHLESSHSSPYSPICMFSLILTSPGSLSVWEHTPFLLFGKSYHIRKRKCCFGIPPQILILT